MTNYRPRIYVISTTKYLSNDMKKVVGKINRNFGIWTMVSVDFEDGDSIIRQVNEISKVNINKKFVVILDSKFLSDMTMFYKILFDINGDKMTFLWDDEFLNLNKEMLYEKVGI